MPHVAYLSASCFGGLALLLTACGPGAPPEETIIEAIESAYAAGRGRLPRGCRVHDVVVRSLRRNRPPLEVEHVRDNGDTIRSTPPQWLSKVHLAGACHFLDGGDMGIRALPNDSAQFIVFELPVDSTGVEYVAYPPPDQR